MASFFGRSSGGKADSEEQHESLGSNLSLEIQRSGFLRKKRFSRVGKPGPWQKRFFVLKDGFLLWYSDKPSKKNLQGTFDPHPKGALPMGGCSVRAVSGQSSKGEDENRAFEVSHPDWHGSLLLAADDEADAAEWCRLLNDARRVTMENALLGDAYIDELEAKGSALQDKAHDALKRAKDEAGRARGELEEKRKLQEQTKELQEHAELAKAKGEELGTLAKTQEKELTEERERAREFESKAETVATELDSERQKRTAVELQLRQAEATLLKLERALKMTQRDSGVAEEINLSVATLKSFFHDKIEEETLGSQETRVIRDGLTGNAQYKKIASALHENTKETNNNAKEGLSNNACNNEGVLI